MIWGLVLIFFGGGLIFGAGAAIGMLFALWAAARLESRVW